MYIPKTLQEENVHNNYLMGLIFSTSWRVDPKKKKNLMGIWIFLKISKFGQKNQGGSQLPILVNNTLTFTH